MPLKGIPHIIADVLKMLFQGGLHPGGAFGNRLLFNLAPLLAFAPAFMLFAIRPGEPRADVLGARLQLQVRQGRLGRPLRLRAGVDRGLRHRPRRVASSNKFALLGGLRASAQLVSYEVTLGSRWWAPSSSSGPCASTSCRSCRG